MFSHRTLRQCFTLNSNNYLPPILFNVGLSELTNPDFRRSITTLRLLHVSNVASKTSNGKQLLNNCETLQVIKKGKKKDQSALDEASRILITPGHLCLALGLVEMTNVSRYFKKYKELHKMTLDLLQVRIATLKSNGIPTERIKVAPWLLLRPYEELKVQIQDAAGILNLDFACAVPFANIPVMKLYKIKKRWQNDKKLLLKIHDGKFSNRIEYLSSRLDLTQEDIAYMMGRVVPISSCPFERVQSVVDVLKEAGVKSEDIYNDPYIFTHGASLLMDRVKLARHHNIENIKPWILRQSDNSFAEYLIRSKRENDLLSGHPNVLSFLQHELNCTSAEVDQILSKISNIYTLKAIKIRETIQFLVQKGYTTEDILESPWVLTHALDTIQLRYRQLQDKGAPRMKINVLCLSSREYKQLLDRLDSINGENSTETMTTSSS